MSTIDWPDALVPQTCQLALRKSGQQFASPFNGTTQALDFIAERWVLSVSLAQMAARNPRGVGSFCNRLAGGVERVRGWNFGHNRGLPMGTLRGVPTLSAGVARGDVALPVAGATAGLNRLLGGGFEVDTNSDGLADGWALYTDGSVGTVTTVRTSGLNSVFSQRLEASAMAASGSVLGVRYATDIPVQAGNVYSAGFDSVDGGQSIALRIEFYTAGSSLISTVGQNYSASLGNVVRRTYAFTAPPTAAFCRLFCLSYDQPGGPTFTAVQFDNVQFQAGAVASAFSGAPTLRADDMLSAGGQLFQVAADTALNDMGAGAVPVVNRVRAAIASSAAVLWDRPTAEFILPAMQAGPVYRPGAIESAALDLVEVWG